MPTYDLLCLRCGEEFIGSSRIDDRRFIKCKCGGLTEIQFKTAPGLAIFDKGWFRDIAKHPIYCDTPQELRDACDKHDAISPYLENSGSFKTREGHHAADPDKREAGCCPDHILHREHLKLKRGEKIGGSADSV